MSDANRVLMKYIQEVTYGTTPASPTMQQMRIVNESLGQDTTSVTSNELRADRQVADFIRTGLSASGDINFELSWSTYDDFFKSSFQSAGLVAAATIAPTPSYTIATAGSNFTITGPSSFLTLFSQTATQLVGRWIQCKGSASAYANGFLKIISCTATVITGTSATATFGAGAAVTDLKIILLSEYINGTTFYSYSMQKQFQDLGSTEYSYFRGLTPSGFSLAVSNDSIVTGAFTFLGVKEVSGAADLATVTTAPTTTNVMNGVDNVVAVVENGAILGIIGATVQLNNNLRARLQVGTLGAVSIGSGTVAVTGTLRAYYTSKTILDEYLNFTASSLALRFNDAAGNAYILDLPRVKFSNGRRVAGGINTDIIADMNFTAYMNPNENSTNGVTIRLAVVAAGA